MREPPAGYSLLMKISRAMAGWALLVIAVVAGVFLLVFLFVDDETDIQKQPTDAPGEGAPAFVVPADVTPAAAA